MNMHPKMTNKDCSLWLSNEEGMLVVRDAFCDFACACKNMCCQENV